MAIEASDMVSQFNSSAAEYDRHFCDDLGMVELYDEIEKQIRLCGEPRGILALGCGTGLDIERIRHRATVTAIDASPEMLRLMQQKELDPAVTLKILCGSYFDMPFGEEKHDLVLSTYSLHHFSPEQKSALYGKVWKALKGGGRFMIGDTVCMNEASLLRSAGFRSVSEVRRWENMALLIAEK